MNHADPWDRQPGESPQAFVAFATYRDREAATRSLARVGQECGKHLSLMERWSARWDRVSRAEAYDAELDRQQLLAREKEIQEARQRHVQLARAGLNKVAQRLDTLDADTIPATTLDRLVKVATDLELRSLGEPTETTRPEPTGNAGGHP